MEMYSPSITTCDQFILYQKIIIEMGFASPKSSYSAKLIHHKLTFFYEGKSGSTLWTKYDAFAANMAHFVSHLLLFFLLSFFLFILSTYDLGDYVRASRARNPSCARDRDLRMVGPRHAHEISCAETEFRREVPNSAVWHIPKHISSKTQNLG